MIGVHGGADDYAIMKQVQQIKLAYPDMEIKMLEGEPDFSRLGRNEKLFLVSHGNAASGELSNIGTADLLKWLKADGVGVPMHFGGIVISSCYSGLGGNGSLAYEIAQNLTGKVAAGTTVAGAKGYSFGTPEFGISGLSSVLPKERSSFYTFTNTESMAKEWLKYEYPPLEHKPTHPEGVLKSKWGIQVNIDLTIEENLNTKNVLQNSPDAVKSQMTVFAEDAKRIETQLKEDIAKIPGKSVAQRAANLVAGSPAAVVDTWNRAIAEQYKLFGDYYLWAPTNEAYTVVRVQ